jgi:TM2 domain-containing membrane protein YozV
MEASKVDLFIGTMGSKFPEEKMILLRERLLSLPEERFTMIQIAPYKDPVTLLLFSIFLGQWGVDRFMLGETGLGVLKLLTCGGLGIWTIIDWFLIIGKAKEYNYQQFIQLSV